MFARKAHKHLNAISSLQFCTDIESGLPEMRQEGRLHFPRCYPWRVATNVERRYHFPCGIANGDS
jgi:hypothetical protein